MIKTEKRTVNGVEFDYTKSDKYLIKKKGTDEVYEEAYDTENSGYEYEETETLIEDTKKVEGVTDEEAAGVAQGEQQV